MHFPVEQIEARLLKKRRQVQTVELVFRAHRKWQAKIDPNSPFNQYPINLRSQSSLTRNNVHHVLSDDAGKARRTKGQLIHVRGEQTDSSALLTGALQGHRMVGNREGEMRRGEVQRQPFSVEQPFR